MSEVLKHMADDDLAASLYDIAAVLQSTVAMPRAAEAVTEAARRLSEASTLHTPCIAETVQ